MDSRLPAILIGSRQNLPYVFPRELVHQIGEWVDWLIPVDGIYHTPVAEQISNPLPERTEVIFSTWGMPKLDGAMLDRLPNLQAVFYAAGSVRYFVTDESWRRGVRIFSSAKANAVPVAEFTVAQLILGLKKAFVLRELARGSWHAGAEIRKNIRGNYNTRIGLISYGAIARHVRRLLRPFDHDVWVYDPFLSEEEAAQEEIRLAGLEELFRECHAVSLHAPWLPETENLVRGHHFLSMRQDAVFINTARGAIVHQAEMTEALRQRPDLMAILDVLYPEPPAQDEPLLQLPNVWITPHIAGSMGHECARMGVYAFDAFRQYRAGSPSLLEIREADMATMA